MYKPKFNSLLVEIEESVEDKYGKGNDESMLGKSYNKGKVIDAQEIVRTNDYPVSSEEIAPLVKELVGKTVMWNEGHEAGAVFEDDGKLYAFIYWWDVRGVKDVN